MNGWALNTDFCHILAIVIIVIIIKVGAVVIIFSIFPAAFDKIELCHVELCFKIFQRKIF